MSAITLGTWAEGVLDSADLAAAHLLPAELANILRRGMQSGQITEETAAAAHADLLQLRLALFPYEPFGARIWQLRHNVTAYDAWYIAVAERLRASLATLDRRLAMAPGPTYAFATP